MKFEMKIESDGAAFADDPFTEIETITSELMDRIAYDNTMTADKPADGTLRDSNGNTVGTWRYTP